MQRLYDYRSKLAYRALFVVSVYLYEQCRHDEDDLAAVSDMTKLASDLLADRTRFLFKGMENEQRVSFYVD
jgi:hypothetical protein